MSNETTLLSFSNQKAMDALLKEENYCNFDLPEYFSFSNIINEARNLINQNISLNTTSAKMHDNVNYQIIANKDGLYAWRPFQLIHPILYVQLVKTITELDNWELICNRFKEFQENTKIKCASIPVISTASQQTQKSKQILNWWTEVEQASLAKSLEFSCLYVTDITDCYGSIYTHSIAWALHGKDFIKFGNNRTNKKLIGNKIDTIIMSMSNGQTNGIPQGSMLMDFISEMVLGYADLLLSKKLTEDQIEDYYIIRYRDDYRIFTNNQQDGVKIIKNLTEILIDLGLKLNSAKTSSSNNLIFGAIKRDKINLLASTLSDKYLISEDIDNLPNDMQLKEKNKKHNNQRLLLQLYDFAEKNQNSGQLKRILTKFFKKLKIDCQKDNLSVLISIIVDLAYNNPSTYPICAAILSKFIDCLDKKEDKIYFISKINNKFKQLPNTGFMDIWLQRISYNIDPSYDYKEKLCKIANGKEVKLWNSDWLDERLKQKLENCSFIDKNKLDQMPSIISQEEVDAFKFLGASDDFDFFDEDDI